jgi:hypothetical protein
LPDRKTESHAVVHLLLYLLFLFSLPEGSEVEPLAVILIRTSVLFEIPVYCSKLKKGENKNPKKQNEKNRTKREKRVKNQTKKSYYLRFIFSTCMQSLLLLFSPSSSF